MLNLSYYKNKIGLNKKLQDYIKKNNTNTFNKLIERNKLLTIPSLINYNKIKNRLVNNTYTLDDHNLHSLANLSEFSNLTEINDLCDSSSEKKKNNTEILILRLIRGTTLFIGITYLIIKKIL
jgi:tRNA U34 5-carboxymethylaminomethyl modifying enzyme MnmG/GidA